MDHQLHCAHVGDSRAVAAVPNESGGFTAIDLTTDHKPSDPEEKKRIEESGGQVRRLEGDIPFRIFQKGKLFIHFTVKFPAPGDLTDDDLAALANVLGKPTAPIVTDDHEECTMHDVDIESEMRRNKQQQKQAHDDSDDEGEGGQRVQCAQQ